MTTFILLLLLGMCGISFVVIVSPFVLGTHYRRWKWRRHHRNKRSRRA